MAPGEAVGLPANATRELTEAIKHHPARPWFLDLHADLSLCADGQRLAEVRVVWAQPYGGVGLPSPLPGYTLLIRNVSSANGLQQDVPALRAALEHSASKGQTEGQVNRLKFIKRQGYGRASFALLGKRVLAA